MYNQISLERKKKQYNVKLISFFYSSLVKGL